MGPFCGWGEHHHELNEDSSWYLEVGAQHHFGYNGHIKIEKKSQNYTEFHYTASWQCHLNTRRVFSWLRYKTRALYIREEGWGVGHQCWEIFIQFVTVVLIQGIEIDSTTLNGSYSIVWPFLSFYYKKRNFNWNTKEKVTRKMSANTRLPLEHDWFLTHAHTFSMGGGDTQGGQSFQLFFFTTDQFRPR